MILLTLKNGISWLMKWLHQSTPFFSTFYHLYNWRSQAALGVMKTKLRKMLIPIIHTKKYAKDIICGSWFPHCNKSLTFPRNSTIAWQVPDAQRAWFWRIGKFLELTNCINLRKKVYQFFPFSGFNNHKTFFYTQFLSH